MSENKSDKRIEFDEAAALAEARNWDQIDPLDTNEQICFVEGARHQFEKDRAELERLRAEIKICVSAKDDWYLAAMDANSMLEGSRAANKILRDALENAVASKERTSDWVAGWEVEAKLALAREDKIDGE